MPNKSETNHTHGHRSRMRDKIVKSETLNHISNYELLECMLFYCNKRSDVKPLAKEIMLGCKDSFKALLSASPEYLSKQHEGLGDSFVCLLKIIKEIQLRSLYEQCKDKVTIETFSNLVEYLTASYSGKTFEIFRAIFLNAKNAIISDETLSKGTVNETSLYPREVVKRALEIGAVSVIITHNHPSGNANPSRADLQITNQLKTALSTVNIELVDHIIVGNNEIFSFKSEGLL